MESVGGFAPTPSDTPRSQTPMQRQDAPTGASSTPASAQDTDQPATASQDASPLTAATKSLGLDKEVQSVVSGFSSFWGSIKKQGTAALQTAEKQYESARADLSPLLSQARANLDHLGEQTRAELQRLSEAPGTNQGVVIGADGMPVILDDGPPPAVDKGKGVDRSGDDAAGTAESHSDPQQTPAAAASAFFASLAKNPNVKELSRNLSTLQSGVSRNLHQIQSQLSHLDLAEGQKVAEDYLHKGEHWFQEFSSEVSKLASDAVKVVPPSGATSGLGFAGAGDSSSGRTSLDKTGAASALSRRELVLYKLRTDTALLVADPAQSADSRDSFAAFVEARGALDADLRAREAAQELEAGGDALQGTHSELVPAKVDEETFWARYFWRKQAIEAEEERRKKVLQVVDQSEDDFSWDMDDEDGASAAASPRLPVAAGMSPTLPSAVPASLDSAVTASVSASTSASDPAGSPTPTSAAAPPPAPPTVTAPAPAPAAAAAAADQSSPTPSATTASERSPRASSDGAGSYDVVGDKSGNPSGDEAAAQAQERARRESVLEKEKDDDEEDSDWE